MLTKQVPNSDILSLLGASGKGAGEKSGASVDGILGSKLSAFSEILKTTGSLKDLSGKDLLAFFSKQAPEGSEGELSELFSKLETAEGRELLKNFKLEGTELKSLDGKTVSLDELAKAIDDKPVAKENLNKEDFTKKSSKVSKLQSAQDFLNSKKAMMRNKTVVVNKNGPKVISSAPGLQQYSKETKVFEKNIIRPFGAQRAEKVSSDNTSSINESLGAAQTPDADPMLMVMKESSAESGAGNESKLASQSTQTVDLSQVTAKNKTELMQKIGQYIENSYVAGSDSVDLVVKHDELGQFRINAQKSGPGSQVNLEINTVTENAQQFFIENEGELMKALNKSGIKVADFKLSNATETFKTSFGESRSNMEQGSHSGSDQQAPGSRSFKQEQGQNKRQRLWQDAKDFSERLHA